MESSAFGTHSLRRTKAAQIYRKTSKLRAVRLLLGHSKIDGAVRYLGIEVDDALATAANSRRAEFVLALPKVSAPA
jgi:integrase